MHVFDLVSTVGFCDAELEAENSHGRYNWSEIEVSRTDSIDCFYQDLNAQNTSSGVSRNCSKHRMWLDYDSGQCITETTFRFQQLSQVRGCKSIMQSG